MYSCSAIRLYKSICPSPLTLSLRCYYYTICKWCMESHLSSDAWCVPCLAVLPTVPFVCCVRGCHALSLALRAVPLAPWLPCHLVPWLLCCVGGLCTWCPGLLACPVWVVFALPCLQDVLHALSDLACSLSSVYGLHRLVSEKCLDFSLLFFRNFKP